MGFSTVGGALERSLWSRMCSMLVVSDQNGARLSTSLNTIKTQSTQVLGLFFAKTKNPYITAVCCCILITDEGYKYQIGMTAKVLKRT